MSMLTEHTDTSALDAVVDWAAGPADDSLSGLESQDLNLSADMSQDETTPTDLEVLRRAYAIRSSWSAQERLHRRREAGQRFETLLAALALPQEAA